jgi:hypothetical protein
MPPVRERSVRGVRGMPLRRRGVFSPKRESSRLSGDSGKVGRPRCLSLHHTTGCCTHLASKHDRRTTARCRAARR